MDARGGLTLRALLVGLALSVVVAMYSAYAGLKVGGVYWPIITATLMSMGLLRVLSRVGGGQVSRQEINVAGTAASTGGLLAAGVLFTVPAAWLVGVELSVLDVTLIALLGGLLGVALTLPLREEMIERLKLPYPDGTATAKVIEAGDEGGGALRALLAAAGIAGLFTLVRDGLRALPPVINLDTLQAPGSRFFSLGTSISLVPLAGGFLIGPLFTGVWFAGAVTSYWLALPWLVSQGYGDKNEVIVALTRPFGIGVIVGASLVYFFVRGVPALVPMLARMVRGDSGRGADPSASPSTRPSARPGAGKGLRVGGVALALVVGILAVSILLDLPLWLTLVGVLGSFAVATIAARIAGELNIDPMEIFAIAALLLVLLFVKLPPREAVTFAALLCIAAGMGGDFMQDLKAGSLVGTKPSDQAWAQVASVVVSALIIGFVLQALDQAYQIGSVELPAPQAVALAAIVEAGEIDAPLAWGGALGAALTALSLATGRGILPVAFGIGLYAPIELSFPLFLGGLLRAWAGRRGSRRREEPPAEESETRETGDAGETPWEQTGRLLAAGAIGGEGLVGVVLALLGLAGIV